MGAELVLDSRTVWGFLFVVVRLGSILVFVPIPGAKSIGAPARVLLVLTLCAALQPLWPRPDPIGTGWSRLATVLAGEFLLGLGAGLLVSYAAEALAFSAQAMALQAGFAYASAIDPSSQADSTVLQIISQLAASLLFFACGLDRVALRAFARSIETQPPGALTFGPAAGLELIRAGGSMLELGLRLALPVAGLLLLTDIALALASRLQAQLQLLSLAFPLKMLGTLAALAASAPMAVWIYRTAVARTAGALDGLLR